MGHRIERAERIHHDSLLAWWFGDSLECGIAASDRGSPLRYPLIHTHENV
jgi:hypothetical protein